MPEVNKQNGSMPFSKMKFLFLFIAIVLIPESGFSQDEYLEQLSNSLSVPVSPNASSLGKYGNHHVSKTNGILNLEVPLIQFINPVIDINISASYSTSGVRVTDRSSNIGLGWALNCGGVITRDMKGMPDESLYGYLNNAVDIPIDKMHEEYIRTSGYADKANELGINISTKTIDYQPDIFSFKFLSYSGQFVIGNNGKAFSLSRDDLKIEYQIVGNDIMEWHITNQDDITFIFGSTEAIEYTDVSNLSNPLPKFVSSWYLKAIKDNTTKEEINFSYYNYSTISINSSISGYAKYVVKSSLALDAAKESPSHITIFGLKAIKEISYKNSVLKFEVSADADAIGKVDKIIYINGDVKQIANLKYSIINASGTCDLPFDCHRLMLQGIEKEISPENTEVYSFQYDTTPLPSRKSKSVDHWGFFNNEGNTSLVPKVKYGQQEIGFASREPNFQYTKAGILTRVTYPTGLVSTFTYEPNYYVTHNNIDILLYEKNAWVDYLKVENILLPSNTESDNLVLKIDYTIEVKPGLIKYPPVYATITVSDLSDNKVVFNSNVKSLDEDLSNIILEPDKNYSVRIETNEAYKISAKIGVYGRKYGEIPKQGGGLRLKETVSIDPFKNKRYMTEYKYNEQGGNINFALPSYVDHTISYKNKPQGPGSNGFTYDIVNYVNVYSNQVGGLNASNASISYTKVSEINYEDDICFGKKEYTYRFQKDINPAVQPTFNSTPIISNANYRNKPLQERYYNYDPDSKGFNLVKQVDYTYESDINVHQVMGFNVSIGATFELMPLPLPYGMEAPFNYSNFILKGSNEILKGVETKQFNDQLVNDHVEHRYFKGVYQPISTINQRNGHEIVRSEVTTVAEHLGLDEFENIENEFYNQFYGCKISSAVCENDASECQQSFSVCREDYEKTKSNILKDTQLSIVQKSRSLKQAQDQFLQCLNTRNYNACIQAKQCKILACQQETFIQYINKSSAALAKVLAKIDNPETKPLAVLALHNKKSTPVRMKNLSNGFLEKEVKLTYREFQENGKELVKVSKVDVSYDGQQYIDKYSFNRYDSRGNITQIIDHSSGFVSSRIFDDDNNIVATVQNASLEEVAYTNFSGANNGWSLNAQSVLEHSNPVNGKFVYHLTSALNSKTLPKGKFLLSVWHEASNLNINVTNGSKKSTATTEGGNGWYLTICEIEFSNVNGSVSLTGNTTIDELRLYPATALLNSYGYKGIGSISSVIDHNNIIQYFNREPAGHLKSILDHKKNLLETYFYNYSNK